MSAKRTVHILFVLEGYCICKELGSNESIGIESA